jgi:hypothetical protein
MNARLNDLLMRDVKSRWAILASSMTAMAFAGFIAERNDLSLGLSQVIAFTVGGASLFGQAALYATFPKIKMKRSFIIRFRDYYGALITVPAAVLVATILAAMTPNVQASVLNRRLRAILNGDAPIRKKSIESKLVLDYATKSNVKLKPELVSAIVTKSGDGTMSVENRANSDGPLDWSAQLAAVNYEYNSRITNRAAAEEPPGEDEIGLIDLDNKTFIDDIIHGYVIKYHGGPMSFKRVVLERVDLQIDDTENGRKLLQAMLDSKDGSLTIDLK